MVEYWIFFRCWELFFCLCWISELSESCMAVEWWFFELILAVGLGLAQKKLKQSRCSQVGLLVAAAMVSGREGQLLLPLQRWQSKSSSVLPLLCYSTGLEFCISIQFSSTKILICPQSLLVLKLRKSSLSRSLESIVIMASPWVRSPISCHVSNRSMVAKHVWIEIKQIELTFLCYDFYENVLMKKFSSIVIGLCEP